MGIDPGTTSSVVAVLEDGTAHVISTALDPVEVAFEIDANGIVQMCAVDLNSERRRQIIVHHRGRPDAVGARGREGRVLTRRSVH